jgi:hypothetical protein
MADMPMINIDKFTDDFAKCEATGPKLRIGDREITLEGKDANEIAMCIEVAARILSYKARH